MKYANICPEMKCEPSIGDPHNRKDTDPITGADMRVVQSKDLGDGRSEIS